MGGHVARRRWKSRAKARWNSRRFDQKCGEIRETATDLCTLHTHAKHTRGLPDCIITKGRLSHNTALARHIQRIPAEGRAGSFLYTRYTTKWD